MGMSVCRQLGGVAALVVGLGLLAGPGSGAAADAKSATAMYKPVIPADTLSQVITEEAKTLQAAVAKASDKKMASKARSVALMIAVYAQDEALRAGPDAAAMAGLRDTTLKLAKAVSDGKLDEAKKLATEIKPAGKADASAKTGPVPVQEDFDIETLMQVFKPDRGGGLEWEKKLQMLRDKRAAYTAADYKTLVPLMYRIASVAQPTEAFAPEPMGKKTPDEWIKLCKEMSSEAIATAELASKSKPDDKMVKASVKRLEATCTSCHDKYRDTK
ncbi:MAG TPA: hypothetical protein VH120_15235 [Gemmataceae bacterium]|jgi:hypothetical protein|nr:hypothetical protein [Gemmataceae bacterium]